MSLAGPGCFQGLTYWFLAPRNGCLCRRTCRLVVIVSFCNLKVALSRKRTRFPFGVSGTVPSCPRTVPARWRTLAQLAIRLVRLSTSLLGDLVFLYDAFVAVQTGFDPVLVMSLFRRQGPYDLKLPMRGQSVSRSFEPVAVCLLDLNGLSGLEPMICHRKKISFPEP